MPFTLLVRLSYRNLFRHARRNLILLVSIAVAIAGVVFLNALLRGMQADLVRSVRINLTGDYRVTAPGYLEDPQAGRGFELTPQQIGQLEALWPGSWSARLVVPIVITALFYLINRREVMGDYTANPVRNLMLAGCIGLSVLLAIQRGPDLLQMLAR